MSRMYRYYIEIQSSRADRKQAIEQALRHEWDFEELSDSGDILSALAEGSLSATCAESQLAERLAQAVWRTNEAFCPVAVEATCLESLPYTKYAFVAADFQRFKAAVHAGPTREPPGQPIVHRLTSRLEKYS